MTEYVIVPQGTDCTIYGALNADTDHEAGLAVLRAVTGDADLASRIFFHDSLAEASRLDTDVVDSALIIDKRWRELAPTRPLPGGQPGGDFQDGDALARRFALRRPGGTWAVVTRWVYLAVPHDEPRDSESRVIEVMSEFVLCKDLHDIHGTEFFAYETVTGLPYQPVPRVVHREAGLLHCTDILWDGREFTDEQARGLLR